jgi:hypothetical protein
MPDHQEISRYCSSLVTLVVVSTESDNVLQLAHFSVKGYLTSTRVESVVALEFQKITASTSIARVCLAYLLQFDHEIRPEEVLIEFPLAKYSAKFWTSYATTNNSEEDSLMGMIEQFFCSFGAPYKVCYGIHSPDEPWVNPRLPVREKEHTEALPLYYAALGGLRKNVQLLLEKNANVNAQGVYGNALQAASFGGHEQVVKLLLEKNAEVNAQSGEYGNALQEASEGGHEAVVKMLLDKGAEVNAQGGEYGNALQAASSEGHERVVTLLLNKEADVNAQGGVFGNALQAALGRGHEAVVRHLVDMGADITGSRREKIDD